MRAIIFGLTVLVLSMLLALPSVALAQEEPAKYSFATAQGASGLQVIPGSECRGVIDFYNVDGNRITHITLDILEAPDNWEVEIAPPLGEQEYEFGGTKITVTENLYAEPTEVYSEEIEDVPEGMVSLPLTNKLEGYLFSTDSVELRDDLDNGIIPEELRGIFEAEGFSLSENATVKNTGEGFLLSEDGTVVKTETGGWLISDEERFTIREEDGRLNIYSPTKTGYCLAKSAYIIVRVPESEDVGTTGDIKILATASWLGQTGAAAIAQTRDFDFTVQTVYELTDEKPITPGEGFDTGKWLPWIILGVVAIVAIASISVLVLRRREG